MTVIDLMFDRLTDWRHLPDYQLERRADIFFACYLPDVLGDRGNIHKTIIPEFPMRIGTLYEGDRRGNLSVKMDYLAATDDLTKVFFIELKTDSKSINVDQCRNMIWAAERIGMKKLIDGILILFRETIEKRKYYRLLEMLESHKLIEIPESIKEMMKSERLNGINRLLTNADIMNVDRWYISKDLKEYEVCYILPRRSEKLSSISSKIRQITFSEFAKVVASKNDDFSMKFASALKIWEERI